MSEIVVTPTPAAPVQAPAPQAPAPQTDWTASLPEDMKGYVQNKGFKDPAAVVDSYRNYEKLMGAPKERLLKLPEKDDSPEWADIHNRLGRPKEANDYQFNLPDAAKDEGFEKWAKGTFHEMGLSKKQAEGIMNKYGEYFKGIHEATMSEDAAVLQKEADSLQKEWGAAYEQNSAIVDRAATVFGMGEDQLSALRDAMGPAGAMKFLHNIGVKLGEDKFVSGEKGNGFGVLSPAAARDRITSLMSDKDFQSRYLNGDVGAKDEMERLHKFAYSP